METIDRLEEEKMRDKIDQSNLSINYDSVVKERDILARETFSSQTEAVTIKIKMESLENKLRRETRRKEELEKAMNELKNDNETVVANIDMNIAKISKEQKYLVESAKAVIELNKRLQTFCLCSHAINEKNKAEIKDLRNKLITLSTNESQSSVTNNKLHPEIEALCFKLKEMSMELKHKMQDSTMLEENINKIFQELSSKFNTNESNIINQNNQ
ncbi:tropomyosin-like [Hylaeus volcanicus]|uniref:tropomyosin-like n=1 Tax=Hylaeus volcanicus TaxID=313075 RepID=UPI0023B7D455|nr:tropomyosin-like [Hylaeus volcanicus]